MKKLISERFAVLTMQLLFSGILVFHILVITGFIPFDIVWAGKLKTKEEMIVFETVSILLNSVMMLVVAIRGKLIKLKDREKLITGVLWAMVLLFGLNTVGNLFAESSLETIIFTPVTFILALLSLRLALR